MRCYFVCLLQLCNLHEGVCYGARPCASQFLHVSTCYRRDVFPAWWSRQAMHLSLIYIITASRQKHAVHSLWISVFFPGRRFKIAYHNCMPYFFGHFQQSWRCLITLSSPFQHCIKEGYLLKQSGSFQVKKIIEHTMKYIFWHWKKPPKFVSLITNGAFLSFFLFCLRTIFSIRGKMLISFCQRLQHMFLANENIPSYIPIRSN